MARPASSTEPGGRPSADVVVCKLARGRSLLSDRRLGARAGIADAKACVRGAGDCVWFFSPAAYVYCLLSSPPSRGSSVPHADSVRRGGTGGLGAGLIPAPDDTDSGHSLPHRRGTCHEQHGSPRCSGRTVSSASIALKLRTASERSTPARPNPQTRSSAPRGEKTLNPLWGWNRT